MRRYSHIYWDGYEIGYSFDEGGIGEFTLYPKPKVPLTKEQENEILELIKENISENDDG